MEGPVPGDPMAYRYRMSRRIVRDCRNPKKFDADRKNAKPPFQTVIFFPGSNAL